MDVKKCIVLFSLLMFFVGCEDNFDPDQWKGTNISGGYSGRMTLLVDGYNWVSGVQGDATSLPVGFYITRNRTVKLSIDNDIRYSSDDVYHVLNIQLTVNDIDVADDDNRILLSATNPNASCVITDEVVNGITSEICVISSVSGYIEDNGDVWIEMVSTTNSDRNVESEVVIKLSGTKQS